MPTFIVLTMSLNDPFLANAPTSHSHENTRDFMLFSEGDITGTLVIQGWINLAISSYTYRWEILQTSGYFKNPFGA